MNAFRGSGPHSEVFRALAEWCSEARTAHWLQDSDALPSWEEAHQRVAAGGRAYKVDHPNARHTAGEIGPLRVLQFAGKPLKEIVVDQCAERLSRLENRLGSREATGMPVEPDRSTRRGQKKPSCNTPRFLR